MGAGGNPFGMRPFQPGSPAVAVISASLCAVLLATAGCGAAAPGGGMSLRAAEATSATAMSEAAAAVASSSASAARPGPPPPQPVVQPVTGMATTASLAGWHVGVGAGPSPAIVPSPGNPQSPALRLAGDRAFVWQDPHTVIPAFSFDVRTDGLVDFYFGADDAGQGYLFRLDTRGGTNYSGFARTASWTAWDCPGGGTADAPADTWIHVSIAIAGSGVVAAASWPGRRESFQLTGQADGCSASGQARTLGPYRPAGTAFGFQGDGLGASSFSWVRNLR